MPAYDFAAIEKKWQARWEQTGAFRQPNPGEKGFTDQPKFYVLDMFPYPSGAGLHVGHPVGYVATDVVARYRRMRGFNVLHPMGYDAFGLPAEQYAIEHGVHPRVTTEQNIANMERQLKMFGFSYDWSRRLATTDAGYYHWTQWIFLQMFNSWYDPEAGAARPISELVHRLESGQYLVGPAGQTVANLSDGLASWLGDVVGTSKWHELSPSERRALIDNHRLAYMDEVPVNWCPQLGTVLANEEVTNEGRSDRGDWPVYRRAMTQWMLRITAYAERLAADLDGVDWPEPIKLMQRNWIGKSTGANVAFRVADLRGGTAFQAVPNDALIELAALPVEDRPELYAKSFEPCDPFPKGRPSPPEQSMSRRNLPHITVPGASYFVTFRTAEHQPLDPGEERDVVFNSLLFGHGKSFILYAGVVMDDHVHMILRPLGENTLSAILHGIKRHTARQINLLRQCGGHLWQDESFDHIIRDGRSFNQYLHYVIDNPVKRELADRANRYRWLFVNEEEVVNDQGKPVGHSLKSCATSDEEVIEVYTTRPDTLFGATYMVLAPEHPLVAEITADAQRAAVNEYVAQAARKSELERTAEAKEKTGVFTGAYAVNPVTDKPIPVWIADYVMMGYGTGAIMAVPAHDTRDLEFAEKFHLPVVQVVQPPASEDWRGFVGDGVAVNSGPYDGLPTAEVKAKITAWLEKHHLGKAAVNYKLRDWIFSRQKYWGEPFPIVHCDRCGAVGLPEDHLPLELPPMEDFKPRVSDDPDAPPAPPLGRLEQWASTPCPACGGPARRELNTMPQWAGSCWYYLRFLDPTNNKKFCERTIERYWMSPGGVDLYVGGAEHAVLHLLYARFWHKVLFDLGCVSTSEPFAKLFNQGMIRSFAYRDGRGVYVGYGDIDFRDDGAYHKPTGEKLSESVEKMSKSLKNVVNPDDVIARYGADTFRMYEMFLGPLEASKPWNTRDVPGVHRFLQRVWRMIVGDPDAKSLLAARADADVERALHKLTRKVGQDIEAMKFNTAIAAMMEFVNAVYKAGAITQVQAERFVLLLAPFAPHVAEELWEKLGHAESLSAAPWPPYDEAEIAEARVELAVQVNGKVRGRITVAVDADDQAALDAALADPKVAAAVKGKRIVKKIVVPGRLVNLVVK